MTEDNNNPSCTDLPFQSGLINRLRSTRSCRVCEGDGTQYNGKECGGCDGTGQVTRYDRTGPEAAYEIERLREERYQLAYAITGGEDAPGLLDSLPVGQLVDIARSNEQRYGEQIDRAETVNALRSRLNMDGYIGGLKRYDEHPDGGGMREDVLGGYVRTADILELIVENDRLQRRTMPNHVIIIDGVGHYVSTAVKEAFDKMKAACDAVASAASYRMDIGAVEACRLVSKSITMEEDGPTIYFNGKGEDYIRQVAVFEHSAEADSGVIPNYAQGFGDGLREAARTLRDAAEDHREQGISSKKVLESQAHQLASALFASWANGIEMNADGFGKS